MSKASAIETIQQTIVDEAKADAKRIIDEAKVSAHQLVEEAMKRAQENLTGWADRRRQMAKGIGDRLIGKARNDAHMKILDSKAHIINEASVQARKRFEKEQGKAQYKAFLKTLIINAGIQIGGGEIVVITRKDDQALISKITGLATSISKNVGKSTKVTVGKKPLDMVGGVFVQNKDGNITVDYRLDTLLQQVTQQYRNDIANTLFTEKPTVEKGRG